MFDFFANFFGYILNIIYNFVNNYGVSIIIFTIVLKLIMLPISIKQQKTMKKTAKVQVKIKELQEKYSNDPVRLNQEMIDVYKQENMSPFSGCLSSIAQIILILAVFYLVKSPLTYMKKVDTNLINDYKNKLEVSTNYPEVQIIKEFGGEDSQVYINLDFLGLDLSSVPSSNMSEFKTLIIPFLYVISSIISTKLTMNMQNKNMKEENKEKKEETAEDVMKSTSKSMTYMMPVMAFSISLVAPLGLALYWLMSNVLMIIERVVLNIIKAKKEKKEELA